MQTIEILDKLLTCDLCCDLELELTSETCTLNPREKLAAELLARLYRIVHGANRKNSCWKVHDDWRKEARELAKVFATETGQKPIDAVSLEVNAGR